MSAGLREAIRSAREQHRAGAGAVLDILMRSVIAAEVLERLEAEAGVAPLLSHERLVPDFSKWSCADAASSRSVVVRSAQGGMLLAAEDPWDDSMVQRVCRRLGASLMPAAAGREALDAWLGQGLAAAPEQRDRAAGTTGPGATAHGPIVAFVDDALRGALRTGASDIHFECDRGGVTVKHRIDGVMSRFARLEGSDAAQEVISRIKVLAQLDITERRLPQDGRFRFATGNESIDLRVSVMPSIHGEDTVLRLLDKSKLRLQQAVVTLAALGFGEQAAAQIRDLAERPNGMLLVTGPTGSGKTTTVYAALSEIHTGIEKIITIEDPVEYELPGVLQIPVNERKGLTFAKGLRSILRHDPDRILVGEIRDSETAEVAVQSALTGHLVFTTVHANSIADIMGRFRHFGLDMFGFMSSLNGVVVQRLVRRLCLACAQARETTPREAAWLVRQGMPCVSSVPRVVGCGACHHTCYDGRFVIAEIHEIDDGLRDAVTEGAPVSTIRRHAVEQGVAPLARLAAERVLAGQTTLEEVRRVVGWD